MSNQPAKVVVITGASSGIGEAIALRLAAAGAKVVLGARSPAPLEDLAERIHRAGGTATPVPTNVASRTDMLHLITTAQQQHGRLDVLINNAGLSRLSRLDALQVDDWDEMIDVNLRGVLYGLAAALPIFKQQQSGHVINILSTSGLKIVLLQAVYAATKNAVRTLSEALRQESGGNLRVTGISPGFVKTNIAASITDPRRRPPSSKRWTASPSRPTQSPAPSPSPSISPATSTSTTSSSALRPRTDKQPSRSRKPSPASIPQLAPTMRSHARH